MLKETISLHDHYQFEIKLSLPFEDPGSKGIYSVDTYLFIPNSLNIHPGTLGRKEFFGRLKNYIRLRIPWTRLDALDAPQGPLGRLVALLHNAESGQQPIQEEFEDHVKVFCLAAKRALRARGLKAASSPADRAPGAALEYLCQSRDLLREYRALAPVVRRTGLEHSPAYGYGEEFLSIVTTYYAFRMLDRLQAMPAAQEAARQVHAFISAELACRSRLTGAAIPRPDDDNEHFVFRWSMLKKYMSSALFLDVRERRDRRFWQQVVAGVAAGVAMVVATAIAFIWQGRYGSLSTPLFMALIISYIFKDRMKDLLKASMSSWLRRILADRKLAIFRNFTTLVGVCKETFGYVSEKSLPPEILALRDKVHMVDVSNAFRKETIIHYHKDIIVKPRAHSLMANGFCDGMLDITRLGVHDFLHSMDDPEEPLYVLDGDRCRRVRGSKVYHLNMIRSRIGPEGRKSSRYRIVLDRDGIKRVERIR